MLPVTDWDSGVALELASRIHGIVKRVHTAGGSSTLLAPWDSKAWESNGIKCLEKLLPHFVQRGLCCDGSRWRRTICVKSDSALVSQGNLICPGSAFPPHDGHASTRGNQRVSGRFIANNLLSYCLPTSTIRWVTRAAVLELSKSQIVWPSERSAFPPVSRAAVEEAEWHEVWTNRWRDVAEKIYVKGGRAFFMQFVG